MTSPRVVLLAGPGRSARILFNALHEHFRIPAVILEGRVARKEFLQRRLRRLGLATVVGQLIFQATALPVLKLFSIKRIREIETENRLSDKPIPQRIIRKVQSINDKESREHLRSLQPDVILVAGTRILSTDLLAELSAPILNVHAGITPLYRGVHGAYWALTRGDLDHCGVTIHLVDEGIDTGGILEQRPIRPSASDSFATYPLLQLAEAIPALKEKIPLVCRKDIPILDPPQGMSCLWSHPTIIEYLRNFWVKGVR